jgi:opacity protein-like surface antigen
MKKFLLLMLVAVMAFPELNAQFTEVGGGLTYGTGFHFNKTTGIGSDLYRSPNAGIYLTCIYKANLKIQIIPSFTYFLPRTNSYTYAASNLTDKTRVSSMMFDINGHYIFNTLDRFEFYGLAGLDIELAHIKWVGTVSKESDNVFGLNLGAGTYFKLTDQFDIFAEAKYIVSKYHQFMVNAGVLINIDWLKKHENTGIN